MSLTMARVRFYSRRGTPRAACFAALWWVMTRGEPASWVVGLPAVVAATLVSMTLLPTFSWRWQVRGAARFLGYFLWHACIGGLDVAWRALHPRLPLAPGMYTYTLRLPVGPAQTFLVNTVSLLPGTLSATLQENHLTLHALDTNKPILAQLRHLEEVIASLFDVRLASDASQRS